jgi:light-regulated signal transduction histidine kinase (bacteriophytochrome)
MMAVEAGLRAEIDRLKRQNAELEQSNTALARSNEDLERFAFVASHDLHEPLRMMTIYAQLLVSEFNVSTDSHAALCIGNIIAGATRMSDLLSDLLAWTELAARPLGPPEAVDLNLILEIVKQNLKAAIDETNAVVTSECLPIVWAHASHFIPLFQNLIVNAIRYRGDCPPRVHISVQREDGRLRFAVSDNGIGIDPEHHEQIFEPFTRLHGKGVPGTGLGLAICHRVIKRYGGRVGVESRPGEGATFLIVLPDITVNSEPVAEVPDFCG